MSPWVRDAGVPAGPRQSLGEGRDWVQPVGVNPSSEVPLSLPPSLTPRDRRTTFLGSAKTEPEFLYKVGGGIRSDC